MSYEIITMVRDWLEEKLLQWPINTSGTGCSYPPALFMNLCLTMLRVDLCCQSFWQNGTWRINLVQRIVGGYKTCCLVAQLSKYYNRLDFFCRRVCFLRVFNIDPKKWLIFGLGDPFSPQMRAMGTCLYTLEARFWKWIASGMTVEFETRSKEDVLSKMPDFIDKQNKYSWNFSKYVDVKQIWNETVAESRGEKVVRKPIIRTVLGGPHPDIY